MVYYTYHHYFLISNRIMKEQPSQNIEENPWNYPLKLSFDWEKKQFLVTNLDTQATLWVQEYLHLTQHEKNLTQYYTTKWYALVWVKTFWIYSQYLTDLLQSNQNPFQWWEEITIPREWNPGTWFNNEYQSLVFMKLQKQYQWFSPEVEDQIRSISDLLQLVIPK